MPKSFDFGGKGTGAAETPPSVSPRKFEFARNNSVPSVPEEPIQALDPVPRVPKKFGFDNKPATPVAETHRPRTLAPQGRGEAQYARKERPRTLTDDLVDRAKAINPEIPDDIRGKIDSLLKFATMQSLVDFGNQNLAPMLEASKVEAKIARELIRIDASEALNEAKNITQRPLTLMEKLAGKTPTFYEHRFKLAREELSKLVEEAERTTRMYRPEITDLLHDMVAITVTHTEFPDVRMQQIGASRAKTLMQAHGTAIITFQNLDQYSQQCADYVLQIDQMVNVTIPAWARAMGK